MIEPFIFDRFADGDAFHAGRAVEKEHFPVRLMAAKKDDPLPFL